MNFVDALNSATKDSDGIIKIRRKDWDSERFIECEWEDSSWYENDGDQYYLDANEMAEQHWEPYEPQCKHEASHISGNTFTHICAKCDQKIKSTEWAINKED